MKYWIWNNDPFAQFNTRDTSSYDEYLFPASLYCTVIISSCEEKHDLGRPVVHPGDDSDGAEEAEEDTGPPPGTAGQQRHSHHQPQTG